MKTLHSTFGPTGSLLLLPMLALFALVLASGCDAEPEMSEADAVDDVCARVTCSPGQTCCPTADGGASCVSLDGDPTHCGACDSRCSPAEVCSLGVCSDSCEGGLTLCDRGCFATGSDRGHCGGCERSCDVDEVCRTGLCEACGEGHFVCGNSCIDPLTDRNYCGATSCDTPTPATTCPSGQVCDGTGTCSSTCTAEYTLCEADCFDLETSSLHCGACGASCDVTERCEGGSCVCRVGLTLCGTACRQTSNDPSHCGACDVACATDESCRDGVCTPCGAGEFDCGPVVGCVDPQRDAAYCGASGCVPVPPGCDPDALCISGACRRAQRPRIATAEGFGCAIDAGFSDLDAAGEVVCWGDNSHAIMPPEPGMIVDPAVIAPGLLVEQLALGRSHGCVLSAEGEVLCWGRNQKQQLTEAGDPVATSVPVPINLGAGEGAEVLQVAAAASYSCALTDERVVYCWGEAPDVLDQGLTHPVPFPIAIPDVVQISAGERHLCALEAGGKVWCWGGNLFGQLGPDVSDTFSATPVAVLDGVVEVAAGAAHTCVVSRDGDVLCWGRDTFGALGAHAEVAVSCGAAGVDTCVPTPAPVEGISAPVEELVAARDATCARVAATPSVLCWGENASGLAAQDPVTAPVVEVPSAVEGLGAPALPGDVEVLALAPGAPSGFVCAAVRDVSDGMESVWCWGVNDRGQLGRGDLGEAFSAVPLEVAYTF